MQIVKIQIPDKVESDKAFYELVRRGRVDCLRDNVFLVPEPALELLSNMGINFQELGRGGGDYAQKALRDSTAARTQ